MVTGGSTNAVLHLIAMSRACQDPAVRIGLDDFQRISDETPFLADLKPSGKYVMEDVQNIGGTPGVIKFMIDNNMFDGSQMTVTGKTWAENVADHPGLTPGQEIIKPLSDPVHFSVKIKQARTRFDATPARHRRDACTPSTRRLTGLFTRRSRRRGTCRSCTGTWRRAAAWPRSPVKKEKRLPV